ncbi:DDE-type integrase/transposase/recombinase [Planktothrix sp. FACHB-1355]|nr:DDE-type integrase/transposase/recombinase [Planktothrix sp. FACHB-1355]
MWSSMSEPERQRVRLIQELSAQQHQQQYGQRMRSVAAQLGITERSVRRLVQRYREQGISSLIPQPRRDRGQAKISLEWQKFIVQTYQEGNRGSRAMTPLQVAVRVKVRAQELGVAEYPSHMTVYRILKPWMEKAQQPKPSLGWKGSRLLVKTREGLEIAVEYSNQVWQADHTKVDVLVVDSLGEILGRPWLTIVVDTYSRCIMGMHIGFDAPSAALVCLALRHAILPKQYSSAYELKQSWGTYGLPRYLYTDGGKDFRSQHLEQVTMTLGIVPCLRRQPSDGGIVERPFGTFNREFFSSLPGYVSSDVTTRSPVAETEACLTLVQLERLLVRYIVDHYNIALDARMGDQSRIGRWEAGRMAQLELLGERELDMCLMRRDRRVVYRSGYIQFANLTYQGEHLAAYAGESVIVRYNPRDITTIYIYQHQDGKEVFVTRAHAVGWETETLSYSEAQAISRHRREAGKAISDRSVLEEVRSRDASVKHLKRQKQKKPNTDAIVSSTDTNKIPTKQAGDSIQLADNETPKPKRSVPYVRVYDYEQLKREAGWW